ncbi:hypothetical protein AX15_007157 [Amanita polypyramis BW_CC]|nr:hypothetical protein AX15_007157 [Amanita polypyramis BW_CC]
MTGPHVYGATALPYQPTPYTAYYTTPQHSPFIPPTDIGNYPPSPYRNNSPLPNTADLPPNTVQFPGSYDAGGYPYAPQPQYPYRPRAPSYHGPPISPYQPSPVPVQASPWPRQQRLSNPMTPGVVPGTPYPWSVGGSPLPGPYMDLPGSFALHPFLNGETPRPDLAFNLAYQHFTPVQLVHGQSLPLTPDVLQLPATSPPVYSLKIVCDEIPEWPITLEFDPTNYLEETGAMLTYPPPISVGDVLTHIHRTLHERITHGDWARLDARKKYKVTQAYTARCERAPTMEHLLKNEGVKKVDYLTDKIWFRGLVRTGQRNDVLKLVVARR